MIRLAAAATCCALVAQIQPPRDARSLPVAAAAASILGTVVSDEPQPKLLRRAVVVLSGSDSSDTQTAITDDQGRFQFTGLAAGQYGLVAAKEGFVGQVYGSSRPAPRRRGSAPATAALMLHAAESRTVAMRLPRGAVITGAVTDPEGQPISGILVAALIDRFEPGSGVRLPSLTEDATTDDRGVYRIFGLPPGAYVIYARASIGLDGPVLRRSTSDSDRVVATPTYYPSTADGGQASRITLATGEERDGIDLQVRYLPTAAVMGFVSGANSPLVDDTVVLTRTDDALAASVVIGRSPISTDGHFVFPAVAPGHYTLRTQHVSTNELSRSTTWGATDIVVDGEDIADVGIQLQPTLSLSGNLVFEGAAPVPTASGLKATLPLLPSLPLGLPSPTLQVLDDARFTINGLIPSVYRPVLSGINLPGIRAPIGSWWLKSIAVGGREMLDAPLDISYESRDAVVTLADQASAVSGEVKDASGSPMAGASVVVFSADRTFWFVQSRRVIGVRTDAQGRYTIRNLPPGEYHVAAVLDLDQGEWFDSDVLQRLLPAAVPVTIVGVERKMLDLLAPPISRVPFP